MQVLYIDVYFFLNFTIDILASFFSSKFLRLRTALWRLVSIGSFGAICAIVDVFIGDALVFRIVNSSLFLLLAAIVVAKRVSLLRRVKFAVAFYIFEALLGGVVHYMYSLLSRYAEDVFDYISASDNNRGALIFSLIILFSIGVLRIFIMMFSGNSNVKSAVVRLKVGDTEITNDALVDSGNLVKDPMSMCPVIFIKESFAEVFLPREVVALENIDHLDHSFRKRIRLVPVTRDGKTRVMTGLRLDEVEVISAFGNGLVDATVVIDKDGGSYGGFECLLPSCVVDDV